MRTQIKPAPVGTVNLNEYIINNEADTADVYDWDAMTKYLDLEFSKLIPIEARDLKPLYLLKKAYSNEPRKYFCRLSENLVFIQAVVDNIIGDTRTVNMSKRIYFTNLIEQK